MTEQMEITMETLKARVNSSSMYAMDMYFSRDFSAFANRPETEVLGVLRDLIHRYEARMKGRGKYEAATRSACESILYWYETANEYTLDDVAGFVASHDPACVWAVLIGRDTPVQAK